MECGGSAGRGGCPGAGFAAVPVAGRPQPGRGRCPLPAPGQRPLPLAVVGSGRSRPDGPAVRAGRRRAVSAAPGSHDVAPLPGLGGGRPGHGGRRDLRAGHRHRQLRPMADQGAVGDPGSPGRRAALPRDALRSGRTGLALPPPELAIPSRFLDRCGVRPGPPPAHRIRPRRLAGGPELHAGPGEWCSAPSASAPAVFGRRSGSMPRATPSPWPPAHSDRPRRVSSRLAAGAPPAEQIKGRRLCRRPLICDGEPACKPGSVRRVLRTPPGWPSI